LTTMRRKFFKLGRAMVSVEWSGLDGKQYAPPP
jgi:hypothetical protein